MSTEQNKAIIHRIPEEIFNQGKLDVADEVCQPNYIEHGNLPPDWPTGVAALKQYVTMIRGAFPDIHLTIEDEIAEGDKVVVRITNRGTHKGEFMGIPATGKQVTWTEMHICRMADGKLAEHWENSDMLGLMQQLGAVPTPGE